MQNIIDNTKKILDQAIIGGGTTIRTYTSSEGVHGHFQDSLLVHNKEGKNCINCNSIIKRIKIGGRSTFYCEKCQK